MTASLAQCTCRELGGSCPGYDGACGVVGFVLFWPSSGQMQQAGACGSSVCMSAIQLVQLPLALGLQSRQEPAT